MKPKTYYLYGRVRSDARRTMLRDPNLSSGACKLYTELDDSLGLTARADQRLRGFTREDLASKLACPPRTIDRWMGELQQAGYLSVTPLPGGGNRQQLRWQVDEQSKLAPEPSTVSIVEAVDPLEPGVDGGQESTIEAVDS